MFQTYIKFLKNIFGFFVDGVINKIFGAQIVKIFFVLYVHGKGGTAEEVEHFKKFFVGSEIVSFDYKSEGVFIEEM